MNASPTYGTPWDPVGYYELRLDTDEDYVEDITWHDLPFLVISAGTRNHFALDLGLNREDLANSAPVPVQPDRERSPQGR